ncbi:hypothetical protein EMIT0P12_110061 [Pseudomonas sp. IT-P12]
MSGCRYREPARSHKDLPCSCYWRNTLKPGGSEPAPGGVPTMDDRTPQNLSPRHHR